MQGDEWQPQRKSAQGAGPENQPVRQAIAHPARPGQDEETRLGHAYDS